MSTVIWIASIHTEYQPHVKAMHQLHVQQYQDVESSQYFGNCYEHIQQVALKCTITINVARSDPDVETAAKIMH